MPTGALLPGEEGELGEMVSEGLTSYFQSSEGAGAFKMALGTFMLVRARALGVGSSAARA